MIGRPRGISKTNAQKQFCDRGHEFTDANTYRYIDASGYRHRQCRACNAINAARRYRAKLKVSKHAGNRGNA